MDVVMVFSLADSRPVGSPPAARRTSAKAMYQQQATRRGKILAPVGEPGHTALRLSERYRAKSALSPPVHQPCHCKLLAQQRELVAGPVVSPGWLWVAEMARVSLPG